MKWLRVKTWMALSSYLSSVSRKRAAQLLFSFWMSNRTKSGQVMVCLQTFLTDLLNNTRCNWSHLTFGINHLQVSEVSCRDLCHPKKISVSFKSSRTYFHVFPLKHLLWGGLNRMACDLPEGQSSPHPLRSAHLGSHLSQCSEST